MGHSDAPHPSDINRDTGVAKSSYKAKQLIRKASCELLTSKVENKRPHCWRMQRHEPCKYQLFPKDKKALQPVTLPKRTSPERSSLQQRAMAIEQEDSLDRGAGEKPGSLRSRIREHSLTRRKKCTATDLEPMTTVQEMPMDSPTIPKRLLYEQPIGSSTNFSRHRAISDSSEKICDTPRHSPGPGPESTSRNSKFTNPRFPSPARALPPLIIPKENTSVLRRENSLRSGSTGNAPADPTSRPERVDGSPRYRKPSIPYTPVSSSTQTSTPWSQTTNSTLPTPISAVTDFHEFSQIIERSASTTPRVGTPQKLDGIKSTPMAKDIEVAARLITPVSHKRNYTEADIPPRRSPAISHRRNNTEFDIPAQQGSPIPSHRRNRSESASVMERGRPRKRCDGANIGGGFKKSASTERRKFVHLPEGRRVCDVCQTLPETELTTLRTQALEQTSRFEVLRKSDVDKLSKELRQLDQRTEYLRHTYGSLRAGRRNLQSRICQFLRSPRTARFSYESMLKQEEALADLDASIDDWVAKLEHAENRRTRVRQKLLEHIAAASTISPSKPPPSEHTTEFSSSPSDISPPQVLLQGDSSPSDRSSPLSVSPQRVVARVPSMLPQTTVDDPTKDDPGLFTDSPDTEDARKRMESIRIYADGDVYALLADVENEFTKLSAPNPKTPFITPQPEIPEDKVRELHRERSHEMLSGTVFARNDEATPAALLSSWPPRKEAPSDETKIYLTSAVFRPDVTVGA